MSKRCETGSHNSTQRAQCSTAPEMFSVISQRSNTGKAEVQCLTHAERSEARGDKAEIILT
jgi:hypothetical protein